MAAKCIEVEVTQVWRWTDHLFSFRTERPSGFRFTPGQFARLGIKADASDAAPSIWRAYSMVSGPYDEYLEYYSIVVPDGAFTSRLQHLKAGDTLFMEEQNHGFLTLERFALEGDLWMLASGTGLAPFMSMLADPLTWESFDRILLVHSVREEKELAYREEIEGFKDHPIYGEWAHKLHYQPVVTRRGQNSPTTEFPFSFKAKNSSRFWSAQCLWSARNLCSAAILRWSTTRVPRSSSGDLSRLVPQGLGRLPPRTIGSGSCPSAILRRLPWAPLTKT
ncbi:MAG: Ferredoxin-NADP reductase [Pseudomonadota bacterium]